MIDKSTPALMVILAALAALSEMLPSLAPVIAIVARALSSMPEEQLALLDQAISAMPAPDKIDAADARIYAEELAKKLFATKEK